MAAPQVSGEKNRVEYRRGDLTEWYVNESAGLEQGFTVAKPPAGTGPVVLDLTTSGLRPRLVDGAVVLDDTSGKPALHYDGLHVTDSNGVDVPAHLGVEAGRVTIAVEDAVAAYPLTIDPVVWAFQGQLIADGGDYYDQAGFSIAISGDTAVVGAPYDDQGTNNSAYDAGSAYVFVRTGGAWTPPEAPRRVRRRRRRPLRMERGHLRRHHRRGGLR